MKILKPLTCLLMMLTTAPATAQQEIPLWGDEAPAFSKPHQLVEHYAECWDEFCVYDVVDPTLTLYIPDGASNGNAVIILPGGGYQTEAIYYEGFEIAEALAKRGTVAAVLKYRLPKPETATKPEKVPLSDVRQALRHLRSKQQNYGFSAQRFGLLGFSAGAHLATAASVKTVEETSQNPDFSMLIYGVTRLSRDNLRWLEQTLYHRPLSSDEIAEETLLERVNQDTPPAFLVHALDDDVCHYTESTLYAEALTEHGVDAEMHLFAHGGHGFGAGRDQDGTSQWIDLAANWLDRLGVQTAD